MELLAIENVLPVGDVIVTVQLFAVPLAALANGCGGEPAAVRIDESIVFPVVVSLSLLLASIPCVRRSPW